MRLGGKRDIVDGPILQGDTSLIERDKDFVRESSVEAVLLCFNIRLRAGSEASHHEEGMKVLRHK